MIAEAHSCRTLVKTQIQKAPDSTDLPQIDRFLMFNSFVATLERSRALLTQCSTSSEAADFASRTYTRIAEIKPQFGDDLSINALELTWHACKNYNLGIALLSTGDPSSQKLRAIQSYTILDKAKQYIGDAMGIINGQEIMDPPQLKGWAEQLQKEIREARIKAAASAKGIKEKIEEGDEPFLDDLDSYKNCQNLVTVPPDPRIITPKPLTFDLARDYIDYPDIKSKVEKKGWGARLKFW